MTRSNKIIAACVIVVFLIPNILAIVKGKESYPFTPAPMFGHYIGADTRFYDIVFTGEGDSVEEVIFPEHAENKNQLAIKRFFFDRVYGSVEKNSPLWSNQNDTKKDLEQRVTSFFRVYFKNLENNHFRRIRLEVKEYDHDYTETSSHLVGSFDLSSQKYTHIWQKNR